MTDEDFSYAKQKQYLDKLILTQVENGKDANEVLAMPYHFVMQILRDQNKARQETKRTDSLIKAFGG